MIEAGPVDVTVDETPIVVTDGAEWFSLTSTTSFSPWLREADDDWKSILPQPTITNTAEAATKERLVRRLKRKMFPAKSSIINLSGVKTDTLPNTSSRRSRVSTTRWNLSWERMPGSFLTLARATFTRKAATINGT
ncbi:MAG: hypothetical protein EOP05_04885 [Proteobacteria bacterium]|nr:MAG: hypothetical protein EOP05_04885 [Pseudomonadota bacterium]